MTERSGEVFDLGYQRYAGPREGRMRARKALWVNGVRTSLGLGRGVRSKILPALLFVAVMAPALILVIIASVTEDFGVSDLVDVPGHADYYGIVSLLVMLFSAIIAPELLCTDRRERVLDLYLVRPLTSDDYVLGRWLAFFTITLALVYSGQVVLFAGFILAADEPLQYVRDNWLDVPRFLGAGLVVAAFTTTIPLAVASFTSRRAYAAGFVIGLFVISTATAGIFTESSNCVTETVTRQTDQGTHTDVVETCEYLSGDYRSWVAMINLLDVPITVSNMFFGVEEADDFSTVSGELPTAVPIAWYLFLTVGPASLVLWRYRRVQV